MIILLLLLFPQAHAWENHQSLLVQMMDSPMAAQREYLKNTIVVPSGEEQRKTLEALNVELQVNVDKIPLQKAGKVTIRQFLTSPDYVSIDESDFGMDQDLPDSTDPRGDRAWMGGKAGPTSQGFRHMFFPGMEWMSPLRTLQIPLKAIGQAPERILKLHAISEKFLQEKNLYWALRTRLWELHLIQDLHQPFHVMQVPDIRMLPWKNLFRGFVARSTQVIGNFHYAYEGLILESLQEGVASPLHSCFGGATEKKDLSEPLVKEIVTHARARAQEIGSALYGLWSEQLKDPEVDLPQGIGGLDYYSYLHANAEENGQKEKTVYVRKLLKTTCESMKEVSAITFSELDRFR